MITLEIHGGIQLLMNHSYESDKMVLEEDAFIYLLDNQAFEYFRVDILSRAGTAALLIQCSTDIVGELATLSVLAY